MQAASLASLLQSRPAQCPQHAVDTRGVPEPAEDEACRSPLDCSGNLTQLQNMSEHSNCSTSKCCEL